jgi:hypothetical protein
MIERAIREGWLPGERREVIEKMLEDVRNAKTVRERTAARVLAAFERNQIAAERNQVTESGQDIAAQTDRLRAMVAASPKARKALADLATAGQRPTQEAQQTAG